MSEHLEGLRVATLAFARAAEEAGPKAPVPTTPDWSVRRLLAHQGMVHRWAAATIRGRAADPEAMEAEGVDAVDPVEWLRDGAIEVVTAISGAPADLDAPVFLADAPAPREFWARRQCHETTIHAVDAWSAVVGGYPVARDVEWITTQVAMDGIDELLTGFLPRPVSRLRSDQRQRIVVRPDGHTRAWSVEISTAPPVTRRVESDLVDGDTLLAGDPIALYLTLWNRSDEVSPTGSWELWRDSAQVRWS